MSSILRNNLPPDEELQRHYCLERTDIVPGDAATTAFKKRARLQQAQWRELHRLKIGTQPMCPKPGQQARPLGSRLDLAYARHTGANFLNDKVRRAVEYRIAHPEKYQLINVDRLSCDLLSSMPMCFNLFGHLHNDLNAATRAIRVLWPDVPGEVSAVRFEWSPGRRDFKYLGNQSAFDVAFELLLPDGCVGVVGVETKYHEHCKAESTPGGKSLRHYKSVSEKSGAFKPTAISEILGKDLQQIWLDHLLALSMLQHPSGKWVRFVLVHPEQNPSYSRVSSSYATLLADSATYSTRTIESVLNAEILSQQATAAFRRRYLW